MPAVVWAGHGHDIIDGGHMLSINRQTPILIHQIEWRGRGEKAKLEGAQSIFCVSCTIFMFFSLDNAEGSVEPR